jgi:hypothetical protein
MRDIKKQLNLAVASISDDFFGKDFVSKERNFFERKLSRFLGDLLRSDYAQKPLVFAKDNYVFADFFSDMQQAGISYSREFVHVISPNNKRTKGSPKQRFKNDYDARANIAYVETDSEITVSETDELLQDIKIEDNYVMIDEPILAHFPPLSNQSKMMSADFLPAFNWCRRNPAVYGEDDEDYHQVKVNQPVKSSP